MIIKITIETDTPLNNEGEPEPQLVREAYSIDATELSATQAINLTHAIEHVRSIAWAILERAK